MNYCPVPIKVTANAPVDEITGWLDEGALSVTLN
jgi:hypothetical protein